MIHNTCNNCTDYSYEHGSVSSTSRCVGGRWTGSGGSMMCSPVDCGQPSIPHSRTDCPHGTLYRDICKHECRYPARMIGKKLDGQIMWTFRLN